MICIYLSIVISGAAVMHL